MANQTFFEVTPDVQKSVVTHASDEDRMTLVTEQDVAPVIENAKALAEIGNFDKDMKPVAQIPMVVVEQMMRDGSWNDQAAVRRWLNDPVNKCFRIWQGRV